MRPGWTQAGSGGTRDDGWRVVKDGARGGFAVFDPAGHFQFRSGEAEEAMARVDQVAPTKMTRLQRFSGEVSPAWRLQRAMLLLGVQRAVFEWRGREVVLVLRGTELVGRYQDGGGVVFTDEMVEYLLEEI